MASESDYRLDKDLLDTDHLACNFVGLGYVNTVPALP